MTNEEARIKLEALLPGRVLKIITNECVSPKCFGVMHDMAVNPTLPAHFVIHDVVRFQDRPNGNVRAYSAEGDWCEGKPAALLPRLLEAIGVSVQDVPVAPAPVVEQAVPEPPVVEEPEPEIIEEVVLEPSPIILPEQHVKYPAVRKSRWERFMDWLDKMDRYD